MSSQNKLKLVNSNTTLFWLDITAPSNDFHALWWPGGPWTFAPKIDAHKNCRGGPACLTRRRQTINGIGVPVRGRTNRHRFVPVNTDESLPAPPLLSVIALGGEDCCQLLFVIAYDYLFTAVNYDCGKCLLGVMLFKLSQHLVS